MEIVKIPTGELIRSPHARELVMDRVKDLRDSIREVGVLTPLLVRRAKTIRGGVEVDVYEVMAGGHRKTACQQLEMTEIPCIIVEASDLTAELIEIDENLIRENLSPSQLASAISRRKVIYEELHPETVVGTGTGGYAGRTKDDFANLAKSSAEPAERFTKSTTTATGKSERSVQRAAARGKILGDDNLKRIEGTCLDHGAELDALIKLSPDDREALIARAEAGEEVSAIPVKTPPAVSFATLKADWDGASDKTRTKFRKLVCCKEEDRDAA